MARTFSQWLDTYLSEAEIDLSEQLDVKRGDGMGQMPISFITEHMKLAPPEHTRPMKDTIVKIDFKNGDVKHYLAHLGQALWEEYDKYIAVL